MRFSIASVLALATSVIAQVATDGFNVFATPAVDEKVPAGKPYVVEWDYNSKFPGAITIELYGGPSAAGLQLLSVLATGVDATTETYTWDVAASLGTHARYGLRIVLESNPATFQWSNSFTVGASSETTPSASASASTSASASVSSSVPPASSSAAVTSTKTTSSTTSVVTSATKTSATVTSKITYTNSTSSAVESSTALTSTFESATRSSTPTPSSSSAPVPTGGANSAHAGSFAALFGGVAVALFAL